MLSRARRRSKTLSTPGTRPLHSLDATPTAVVTNWTNTDQQTERHSTPKRPNGQRSFQLWCATRCPSPIHEQCACPIEQRHQRDINSAHSELRCATLCLSLDHKQCAHAIEKRHRATPSSNVLKRRHRVNAIERRHRTGGVRNAIELRL